MRNPREKQKRHAHHTGELAARKTALSASHSQSMSDSTDGGQRSYVYLRFDAPMMSFGAAYSVGSRSRDDPFNSGGHLPQGAARLPPRSTLTGLIGNALGFDRSEVARLQNLHDRIRFAAALVRPGRLEDDLQAAQIGAGDAGWTTRGFPEGRRGGAITYQSPYVRKMQYWADAEVAVTLRLIGDDELDTESVAAALHRPERPLFLGRKTHLPAGPIYRGMHAAKDAYTALEQADLDTMPILWDQREGPDDAPLVRRDDRNWSNGVHAGEYSMHLRDQAPDLQKMKDPMAYHSALRDMVREEDL